MSSEPKRKTIPAPPVPSTNPFAEMRDKLEEAERGLAECQHRVDKVATQRTRAWKQRDKAWNVLEDVSEALLEPGISPGVRCDNANEIIEEFFNG